jgi:hypothetical protein
MSLRIVGSSSSERFGYLRPVLTYRLALRLHWLAQQLASGGAPAAALLRPDEL